MLKQKQFHKLFVLIKRNSLENLTIAYLMLPVMLFFGIWLKPWIAVVAILLTLLCCYSYVTSLYPKSFSEISLSKSNRITLYALAFLLLSLWALFSGIGGFGKSLWDHEKHYGIIKLLQFYGFPPSLPIDASNCTTLTYYYAYYLPAAVIGSLLGWQAGIWTLLLWTVTGVLLAGSWFLKLLKKANPAYLLIFIFYGGLDVLGYLMFNDSLPTIHSRFETFPTKSLPCFQYLGSTQILYYTPQHALTAWLLSALFLKDYFYRPTLGRAGFLVLLGLAWSPLVTIGLLPLFFALILRSKPLSFISLTNCFSILPALIFVFFYSSKSGDINLSFFSYDFYNKWPQMLIVYALEFGLLAFLLFQATHNVLYKRLILISSVFLILFSFVWYGSINEFLYRAPNFATFVFPLLIALIIKELIERKSESLFFSVFVIIIFFSSFSALKHIIKGMNYRNWKSIDMTAAVNPLFRKRQWVRKNYRTNPNSFFYKSLSNVTCSKYASGESLDSNIGIYDTNAIVLRELGKINTQNFIFTFKAMTENNDKPLTVILYKNDTPVYHWSLTKKSHKSVSSELISISNGRKKVVPGSKATHDVQEGLATYSFVVRWPIVETYNNENVTASEVIDTSPADYFKLALLKPGWEVKDSKLAKLKKFDVPL